MPPSAPGTLKAEEPASPGSIDAPPPPTRPVPIPPAKPKEATPVPPADAVDPPAAGPVKPTPAPEKKEVREKTLMEQIPGGNLLNVAARTIQFKGKPVAIGFTRKGIVLNGKLCTMKGDGFGLSIYSVKKAGSTLDIEAGVPLVKSGVSKNTETDLSNTLEALLNGQTYNSTTDAGTKIEIIPPK